MPDPKLDDASRTKVRPRIKETRILLDEELRLVQREAVVLGIPVVISMGAEAKDQLSQAHSIPLKRALVER